MLTEEQIKQRIEYLETKLKENEESYRVMTDFFFKQRLLTQSFNIESQLDALYFVLGINYVYKHM